MKIMKSLINVNLINPNDFAEYYKIKFGLWITSSLSFIIIINSPVGGISYFDRFWDLTIPYISIWEIEIKQGKVSKLFIALYFLIHLSMIIALDCREFFLNRKYIDFRDGLSLKLLTVGGYLAVIYSWFFLGGIGYFRSRGIGIIHDVSIIQLLLYAIGIPGISMIIFWSLTSSNTSKIEI